MTDYNIHNPQIAGLEWPATKKITPAIVASSGRVADFIANTTQTVDRAQLHIRSAVGQTNIVHVGEPLNSLEAQYSIDLYGGGAINPGTVLRAYSLPVETVTGGTTPWHRGDGGADNTNLFNLVDDSWPYTATLANTDRIAAGYPNSGGVNAGHAMIRFRGSTSWRDFNNVSVNPTNKRILNIIVRATMVSFNGVANPVRGQMSNGTTTIDVPIINSTNPVVTLPNNSTVNTFQFSLAGTSRQWRNYETLRWSDVTPMLSGGTGWFGVSVSGIDSAGFGIAIFQMWLEVTYVDETRIATSTATKLVNPTLTGEYAEFLLQDPITGSATTWNKNAGTEYLMVLRGSPRNGPGNVWNGFTTGDTANANPDFLSGQNAGTMPFSQGLSFSPSTAAGLPVFTGGVLTMTVENAAQAFYFQQGATVRADSQPYGDAHDFVVSGGGVFETELSNAAAAPYGMVSILLKNTQAVHDADQPLGVELRRRSDNALLASGSITEAEFPPIADDRWYQIKLRMSAAPVLAAGTQYFLRLTSPTLVGGYTIRVLSAIDATAAAASFGGTTNAATAPLFGEVNYWDVIATVMQVPPVLTGIATTIDTFDTDRLMSGRCIVPRVSYAQLGWSASAIGSAFDHYEIERNDDGEWKRIGRLDDVNDVLFADFESRRNVQAQWRIRQVRNDGVFSDWASFAPQIIPSNPYEVVLASNDAPTQTLGLLDEPGHSYERLSAGRMVEQALYGRDKMLAFREAEDRGDRFSRRFVLAFDDLSIKVFPVLGGRAIYDPLVTLIENPALPHVAFLDWRGRRWYTAPTIADLLHEEPGGRYHAELQFLEVAGPTPASVSFGATPVPPPTGGAYPGGYQEGY